jgi:hypothetical protein
VLSSQYRELVYQEIWGMLALHFDIRELMYDVSASTRGDPVALSFVGFLRMRAPVLSPVRVLPLRSCCRHSAAQAINSLTKYHNHSNWPQPSREANDLIYVIGADPSVAGIVT